MNQLFTLIFTLTLFISNGLFGRSFEWAVSSADSGAKKGSAMAIDDEKNIYLIGKLEGKAVFGNKSINGNGSFFVKYKNSGTTNWAMPLNGLKCNGISTDATGNVFIAGSFSDSVFIGKAKYKSEGGLDFFVVKFDSAGKILWARTGGGQGNDIATAVANDYAGLN